MYMYMYTNFLVVGQKNTQAQSAKAVHTYIIGFTKAFPPSTLKLIQRKHVHVHVHVPMQTDFPDLEIIVVLIVSVRRVHDVCVSDYDTAVQCSSWLGDGA